MDTLPFEMVAHILGYTDVLSWARAQVSHRLFHVDTQRERARRDADGRRRYPAPSVCLHCFWNVENVKKLRLCKTCNGQYCSAACRREHRWNDHNKHVRGCLRCWFTVGTYSPLFAMARGCRYHVPKDQIETRKRVANLLAARVLCTLCHERHEKWAFGTRGQRTADDQEVARIVERQRMRKSDIVARVAHNKRVILLSDLYVTRRRTVATLAWLGTQRHSLKDFDSYTEALHNACRRGNDGLVYALLQRGTPYNDVYLELACQHGHGSLVAMLLKNAHCQPSANASSSVRLAASGGHTNIVCALLRDGRADPGASNNEALMLAAKYGYTDVVRALLADRRVDPTQGDVLKAAVQGCRKHSVFALLADKRIVRDFSSKGGALDIVDIAVVNSEWTIMGYLLLALPLAQRDAIVDLFSVETRYQYALYLLRWSMRFDGMRLMRRVAEEYNLAALECGHQEREAGHVEMAVHYYEMATRNDHSWIPGEGFYWCAVVMGDCGQHARAVDYLHKALGRGPHLASMVRLGEYYAHLRGSDAVVTYDIQRARDLWKKVFQSQGSNTHTADARRLLDATIARCVNW